MAAERAKTGAWVMGRRAVRRQSWRDRPRNREPRFGLRPRVAARNQWAHLEALQRNRDFLEAYRAARAGSLALFPPGTCSAGRSRGSAATNLGRGSGGYKPRSGIWGS